MVSQSSGRQGSPWMILDFPGGGRFGWDGCRASGGGAAGGSASLGCFGFFFGGHLFPWSPASLPAFGIIQWEPLSLELALDCPSGDPRSGRQDVLGLGQVPSPRAPARDPSSSPLLSSIPSGSLGSRGNWLEAAVRGNSHPWERRGFPGRGRGAAWVLLPLSLQRRTAESPPVPCPSTACSTSCHARAQIFAKILSVP